MALRGQAPGSGAVGPARRGSRRRASRVAGSTVVRHAARNASASRVRSPWRSMVSARRRWSAAGTAHRPYATVAVRAPASTRAAASGASLRASVRRRSVQPGPWPRSRAIAAAVSPSSSASEPTTRASSIGPTVLRGVLAAKRSALAAGPTACSATTGTLARPSRRHRARRLKPSTTSQAPSPLDTTRSGSAARCSPGSVAGPRRRASVVRSERRGTSRIGVTGGHPPAEGADRADSGRR